MNNNVKVVAIVVTFNRKQYLIDCLNALISQTYHLDAIIIIDNASEDGTRELLEEKFNIDGVFFRYFRQARNCGGAGGFNEGLKKAFETDADWFWLMDDDVAPELNCLIEMLRFKNISECIHPRKVLLNGEDFFWEHNIDILTGGKTFIANKSFENGKDIVFTNVGCFEGMLISRRVVNEIGLPDPKYFISEDDTLYGLKASVHTSVSYISNAVMHKLIPISSSMPWKSYYSIRNSFFLYRDACDYLEVNDSRSSRLIFLFSQFIGLIKVIRRGRAFIVPALRGFYDGLIYMRSRKCSV